MIELIIDGQSCDVSSSSTILLSYDAKQLVDIDEMKEGTYVSVEIPSTLENDVLLANDGYIHAPKRFNADEHTAEVRCDSQRIFWGSAYLGSVEWREGRVWYTILICGQRAEWAVDASANVFNEFAVDLDMKLSVSDIKGQWSSSDPVRFVVVYRDTYTPVQSSVSTEYVKVVAALEDYHPFLHVDTMMRSIFEGSGYSVKSDFMDGEYFKSLYMSGSYGSSTNTTETKNAMDFYVRRYEDATAESNLLGVVYLSPNFVNNSIGAIVDAETVNTESDCYSNGGCFVEVDGFPTFVPLTSVCVGFAIRLRYITPFVIESRDRLKGFDKIHIDTGHDYEIDICNSYLDQRDELRSGYSYMLCIFDFEQGDEWEMYFRMADGSLQYYDTIAQRVTYFISPTSEFSEVVLLSSQGESITTDWAIYNGYVQESGQTEIDVTVRITPDTITPTSPKEFYDLYVSCGEQGWELTLKAETSITPFFAKHPGCNSYISFADIAQHDKYQISLIESMAHMYNLRFWTDESSKVVYIEPYDDMWDWSQVWDWSDKIDRQQSIEFSDLASEVYKVRKWGYRDGDGVTARGDGEIPSDDEFGFWEGEVDSFVAKDGTESLLSPLYSPSQSSDDGVLWVGDRDDVDSLNTFDFTPRIVRHDGEVTYDNVEMPHMTFYDSSSGVSLCFEDRGGMTGLNSYYQRQIDIEQRGRVVTLYMKLTSFDISSLFDRCESAPDIRSIFGLNINGDYARCLLKEIIEYDPLKESVKCRFIVVD